MDVSVEELAGRFKRGLALVLVDVREPFERALCAIAAAESVIDLPIPMNSVPERLDEVRAALKLGSILVYCHHGVRSRMVGEWLIAQGLSPVEHLAGGIDAWSQRVDPSVPRY